MAAQEEPNRRKGKPCRRARTRACFSSCLFLLSGLLLTATYTSASAQNVITIDASGGSCSYTGKLCTDSGTCSSDAVTNLPPSGSANSQNVLKFINVPTQGVNISWVLTNPPTVVSGAAQQTPAMGTADGANYSVPQGPSTFFGSGTRVPDTGGVYQTQISLDEPESGFDYALVQYEVNCRPGGSSSVDGQINIVKNAIGGDGTFHTTISSGSTVIENVPLTTIDGFASDFRRVNPRPPYTVNETPPDGWTLDSIDCVISRGGGSASGNEVTLEAGSIATCTVTNSLSSGSIKIIKETVGGNGDFAFTLKDPGGGVVPLSPGNTLRNGEMAIAENLPPGDYTIEELVPEGWDLSSVNCGQRQGNTVTVTVSGDETVCTFSNFKENDEAMEEETKRFVYRRVDNLLTYGPDRARLLRRLQSQTTSGSNAQPSFAGAATSSAMPLGGVRSGRGNAYAGDGVPWVHEDSSTKPWQNDFRGSMGPTSLSGSMLSALASQLMPLAAGQTSFKFGTSLSEIHAKAAEAEARTQRKKLQAAGLSLANQPYMSPVIATRPVFDVWVEGRYSRYNDDVGGINREGDFGILYVGADYVVAPGILFGALVQVDDTNEDINDPIRTGEIDGTGWMVGPYFGAKLLDNLFFDARAAWGQSDNDIWLDDAAAGYRRGSFDTDRWLATATLTGVHLYDGWRFSPELGLKYGHESYGSYQNSLGQTVEGGDAQIGRLTGGIEVAYRLPGADGVVVEPMVGVEGIWNFDSDDLVIDGVIQDSNDDRAKIEAGVLVTTESGWGLRAAGTYDGIGGDDFDAYGGSLWVNVPLN